MLMTASADTRPLNLLTAEGSVKVVTGDYYIK
jgi:hypothetical protein